MIELFLAVLAAAPAAPATVSCALDERSKVANAALSFEDFDQKGTTPATARALAERGCWSEAAKATEHYLVNGPLGSESQQRVLRFHLAQQLANSGAEQKAAPIMAGARNPGEQLSEPETLRWNDFVQGHWAFFVKDKAALQRSLAAVRSGQGFGNGLNAALLDGLVRCFDQPYLKAVQAPCRIAPEPVAE